MTEIPKAGEIDSVSYVEEVRWLLQPDPSIKRPGVLEMQIEGLAELKEIPQFFRFRDVTYQLFRIDLQTDNLIGIEVADQHQLQPKAGTPGPMESAPRDGTPILLEFDGEWIEGAFHWPDYLKDDGSRPDPYWRVIGLPSHGCGCCGQDNPEPTRWMPMP